MIVGPGGFPKGSPELLRTTTRSAGETRRLGEALGREVLRGGDLAILSGGLGAGKTVLAQGIGAGLEVEGPVVSPTFTLVRCYAGRVPLVHVDVYRLDRFRDLEDLDLEELTEPAAVMLVEWGDLVSPALPAQRLEIDLRRPPEGSGGDDERAVSVVLRGESWRSRADVVARVLRSVPYEGSA